MTLTTREKEEMSLFYDFTLLAIRDASKNNTCDSLKYLRKSEYWKLCSNQNGDLPHQSATL